LRGFIGRALDEEAQQRAITADARRAAENLAAFQNRNPDLANDPRAAAAIERDIQSPAASDYPPTRRSRTLSTRLWGSSPRPGSPPSGRRPPPARARQGEHATTEKPGKSLSDTTSAILDLFGGGEEQGLGNTIAREKGLGETKAIDPEK
jgi:hypothetical protein